VTRGGERNGFTLIEVVVALAILGTGVVILLESHYGTMNLFVTARDAADAEYVVGQALAHAEMEVLSGKLQGDGELGPSLEGFSYSFEAAQQDEVETPGLFEVTVTVHGPNLDRTMNYLVYNGAQVDVGQ
jgi:prepilin-type N-terminal cleavage/methylation domain-containing protein